MASNACQHPVPLSQACLSHLQGSGILLVLSQVLGKCASVDWLLYIFLTQELIVTQMLILTQILTVPNAAVCRWILKGVQITQAARNITLHICAMKACAYDLYGSEKMHIPFALT